MEYSKPILFVLDLGALAGCAQHLGQKPGESNAPLLPAHNRGKVIWKDIHRMD
jgi:hypothetical protein